MNTGSRSGPIPWLQRQLFGNVRRQITIGLGLFQAILLISVIWAISHTEALARLERQRNFGDNLVRNLASASAGWVAARDIAGLQELVNIQADHAQVRYIMILDANNQVLAHNQRQHLGEYVQDMPQAEQAGASVRQVLSESPELYDVIAPIMLAQRPIGWVRLGIDLGSVSQQRLKLRQQGLAYGLLAMLIGSLLAWWLARRLTRRLYAIRKVADAVEQGQHQQHRGALAALQLCLGTHALRHFLMQAHDGNAFATLIKNGRQGNFVVVQASIAPLVDEGAAPRLA